MTAETRSQLSAPACAGLHNEANLPQRILVVDDDDDIRRLNTEVLRRSGYEVDAAEDGAVAWDALQINHYDLVVTDHNMPKLSGMELLKKLHAANKAVPAIMVSGKIPTQELNQCPWLQIEAMLLKPYTFDEFLATVKNVLNATCRVTEDFAPPPNWPGQPLSNGLRL